MNTRFEEEFNQALGHRLMTLRQSQKMSQEYLGARLGVRYQQIQKYETGMARMPPERIAACAKLLNVPVEYFFGTENEANAPKFNKTVLTVAAEIMELPDEDVRKGIYYLARAINKSYEDFDIEQDRKLGT